MSRAGQMFLSMTQSAAKYNPVTFRRGEPPGLGLEQRA